MLFLQKNSYWFFSCIATSFPSAVCSSSLDDLILCSPSCIHKCFPIPDSQTCHRHSQNLLFLLLQNQLLLSNHGPTPNPVDRMVSGIKYGEVLGWPSRLCILLWETLILCSNLSLDQASWDYKWCGSNCLGWKVVLVCHSGELQTDLAASLTTF